MRKTFFIREVGSLKAIILIVALATFVAGYAIASVTGFNIMSGDLELLRLANQSQGGGWSDPISANAGDQVSLRVYYHCGTDRSDWTLVKANNTRVRLSFPTTQQTTVIVTGNVSATNLTTVSDTGVINISSSQKLTLNNTATWYAGGGAGQSVSVSLGSGYGEVSLGTIDCDYMNYYHYAGYVVFTGQISSIFPTPTVDLKVNNSNGPITIPYNTSATLSWTSTNATSCTASGSWSGSKSLSGSESTGNLYSSTSYSIVCTGSGGTASDSVGVNINQPQPQNLYVTLEAIPNSGTAPLNNVDLRATVSGTAQGTINYRFDCTSDGAWDYNFFSVSDNPKTVVDACNYATAGSYVAKVRVERGTAAPAEASAVVTVGTVPIVGSPDISLTKLARNLSDGTNFLSLVPADPGEVIEFRLQVSSTGVSTATNLVVRDTLPDKMSYYGSLKVDNVLAAGDILAGLNIGDLAPQQTKTITFQAVVANAANFGFGTTDLVNTGLVYNTTLARTSMAKVQVNRSQVLGVTTVSTGLFDNFKLAFLLALAITFLFSYFSLFRFYLGNRVYVWGINETVNSAVRKIERYWPKDSEKRLTRVIEEIKKREKL